ncbi:MAG: F0F1 ATP synthase subunit epsilon [Clostridia bacterium]|nr:F0F1 ATP synthase subunit epsilon [Clostridia bacterium]
MPTPNTFKVTIYTPEKLFGTFEAVSLTCNAPDGELCVMRDHMPLLMAIKEGVMRIRTPEKVLEVYTDEGTVFVENNDARVFTDICVWADVDLDEVRERMKRLHEADVESIRHYKEHAVKLARLIADVQTKKTPHL